MHTGLCHGDPSTLGLRHLAGDVWAADNPVKEYAEQISSEEATLQCHIRGSLHSLDASALGLGGGAVPCLGGGTINLASLLGGVGLQTQSNLLAGALGGSTGLLGTARVPNELAGLCARLSGQPTNKKVDCLRAALV